MTTESRMREALEYVASYLEGRLAAFNGPPTLARDRVRVCIDTLREALSPPARRTSEEWTIGGVTYRVHWFDPGETNPYWTMAEKRMDGAGWVPVYDDDRALACAAAIATLANLTPPEEEA